MKSETYRTCQNCGTVNLNSDYCQKCGTLINILLKRRLIREKKALEKQRLERQKPPNKLTVFFENAKEHENLLIRSLSRFFYSIWVVVIAIGSFFALLFGYIAA